MYQLRLAERLGMTLGQLQSSTHPNEIALWIEKDKIEPPHDPYLIAATIIQYMCGVHGVKKIPAATKIFKHLKMFEAKPSMRLQWAKMLAWAGANGDKQVNKR